MIDKNNIKSTWQNLQVFIISSPWIDISGSIDVVHVLESWKQAEGVNEVEVD